MTLAIPIADLTILRAAARLGYDNADEQARIIAEISPTPTVCPALKEEKANAENHSRR